MGDPLEGLTPDGHIRTGADRERIPDRFVPLLHDVVDRISDHHPGVSMYLYGSVANGTARPPASDVDLLTVGLAADHAGALDDELSARWAHECRGVEISAAMPGDLDGDGDAAYGMRVFVHHYCVHLAGPDVDRGTAPFIGDRRAARGFNGDIGQHARRWRALAPEDDPQVLGRRIARKTLLAVGGLVSVHDATWTTDRDRAAHRWTEIRPELSAGLRQLLDWSSERTVADRAEVSSCLDGTIEPIVRRFATDIGLWPE